MATLSLSPGNSFPTPVSDTDDLNVKTWALGLKSPFSVRTEGKFLDFAYANEAIWATDSSTISLCTRFRSSTNAKFPGISKYHQRKLARSEFGWYSNSPAVVTKRKGSLWSTNLSASSFGTEFARPWYMSFTFTAQKSCTVCGSRESSSSYVNFAKVFFPSVSS